MDGQLKNKWIIQPSRQQKISEAALVLVSLLILQPLLNWPALALLLVTLYSFLILMWRTRKTVELQRNPSSWHLKKDSVIHSIQWRAGSVRRKNLIIWRYGFWPWQRLVIYPDSVAEGEFRLLLKALYGV